MLNSNGTLESVGRDNLQLIFIIIAKLYTFLKYLLAVEGTKPVLQMPEVSAMMTEMGKDRMEVSCLHTAKQC